MGPLRRKPRIPIAKPMWNFVKDAIAGGRYGDLIYVERMVDSSYLIYIKCRNQKQECWIGSDFKLFLDYYLKRNSIEGDVNTQFYTRIRRNFFSALVKCNCDGEITDVTKKVSSPQNYKCFLYTGKDPPTNVTVKAEDTKSDTLQLDMTNMTVVTLPTERGQRYFCLVPLVTDDEVSEITNADQQVPSLIPTLKCSGDSRECWTDGTVDDIKMDVDASYVDAIHTESPLVQSGAIIQNPLTTNLLFLNNEEFAAASSLDVQVKDEYLVEPCLSDNFLSDKEEASVKYDKVEVTGNLPDSSFICNAGIQNPLPVDLTLSSLPGKKFSAESKEVDKALEEMPFKDTCFREGKMAVIDEDALTSDAEWSPSGSNFSESDFSEISIPTSPFSDDSDDIIFDFLDKMFLPSMENADINEMNHYFPENEHMWEDYK